MHLRPLHMSDALRAAFAGRFAAPRRLHRLFALAELEELGLSPAELRVLAARGRRSRAAELYGAPAKKPLLAAARRRPPAGKLLFR